MIALMYGLQVITIRIFFKFIIAILSVIISAQKSKDFFKLLDKFKRFDMCTLQMQCPPNVTVQIFYILYVFSIEIYYFSISFLFLDIGLIMSLLWTLISTSSMIMIIQYALYMRMLRDRYKLANFIFSNSKYPKH